jgi:O-antigen ligase
MDLEDAAEYVSENGTRRRGFGTFLHPNATAVFFEILLPLPLALAVTGRTRRSRAWYAALLLFGLTGLVVTFSRGGLIGFVVSGLVCLGLARARGFVSRRVLLGVVVAVLAIGAVGIPKYLGTRPEYFAARFDHLRNGIRVFLSSPIIGVGLNNSSPVRNEVVPGGETAVERALPIHSHLLIGLSEAGIVGFALYVGFFALIAREAIRRSRSPHRYIVVFALTTIGAYSALAVHLVEDFMSFDAFHTLLWFYAGLMMAARRLEESEGGGQVAPPATRPPGRLRTAMRGVDA